MWTVEARHRQCWRLCKHRRVSGSDRAVCEWRPLSWAVRQFVPFDCCECLRPRRRPEGAPAATLLRTCSAAQCSAVRSASFGPGQAADGDCDTASVSAISVASASATSSMFAAASSFVLTLSSSASPASFSTLVLTLRRAAAVRRPLPAQLPLPPSSLLRQPPLLRCGAGGEACHDISAAIS